MPDLYGAGNKYPGENKLFEVDQENSPSVLDEIQTQSVTGYGVAADEENIIMLHATGGIRMIIRIILPQRNHSIASISQIRKTCCLKVTIRVQIHEFDEASDRTSGS